MGIEKKPGDGAGIGTRHAGMGQEWGRLTCCGVGMGI